MDAMIKQTISGYTSVFSAFPVSDEAIKKEIEDFTNEINALGESCSDAMDFMTKYPASGLSEKYSDLIARASAPPPPPAEEEQKEQAQTSKGGLPTVAAFLSQYRVAYDAVKGAGYRKRAEKAYENIFDVENRTDNLIDMNIILEKEKMMWKIVSEDFLDIYQPILDATDTLNLGVVRQFENLIKICEESTCDEELTYKTDIAVHVNQKYSYNFMARSVAAIMFANAIVGYIACKKKFRTWLEPQADLLGVIAQRDAVKRTYEYLKDNFGWDFDYMVNDEWMKSWLLIPIAVDGLGRVKKMLDPQNVEVFRELLFEEILSDRTIDDILLTEQKMVYFYLLNERENEVISKYEAEAKKLNEDYVYFQYQDRLQAAAGDKDVKLPETGDKKKGMLGKLFGKK